MAITVEIKRRKRIDPEEILDKLYDEQLKHAERAIYLYETSVFDWTDHPAFTAISTISGNKMSENIYARGEGRGLYAQLDEGYQRQVRVTEDWISKTQPGILHSRPGRGHVMKHADGSPVLLQSPEPVIPRRFTEQVAELIAPGYFAGMKQVFASEINE